jgi:putative tricarboxylic transport membrane protein
MSGWLTGLEAVVFSPSVLLFIPLGVLLGVLVGAIPGLSATVGIAVFLPFTFTLDPLPGLVLLLGIYNGAAYAGSIPAILVRTPGTPAAAATVLDGYPMARKGEAGQALTISLVASAAGGILGAIILSLLAPVLAEFALAFGPAEYFALGIVALTIIGSLGEGSLAKGFISAGLGVLIAMIGLDPISGFNRFAFGSMELSGGIELIPLLVGLFGVAEALYQIERLRESTPPGGTGRFRIGFGMLRYLSPTVLGSTLIGFFTGILPGVGGDIGGYVAYNETKRFSRGEKTFGEGDPRGVAAAESANNAGQVGGLVPTLTLGIPGNAAAAVLIGALLVQGLQPGPQLFTGSPDLVYGAFIAIFLSFVALIVIGALGIRLWVNLMNVPPQLLWPSIIVLSTIGSYAVRTNPFDVLVMLLAGVLGYFLLKRSFPIAPLLIGVIVGPIVEQNYRRAMIQSGGNFDWMLDPLPLVLLLLAVVSLAASLWRAKRRESS